MDYGNLLSTAISILALAALAGVGLQRGKVTNLRDNLKDAREEIADKDRRLTALETSDAKKTADLEALSRVVTGEAHWVALGQQFTELSTQLFEHHTQVTALIGKIIRALENRGAS